jgi:hypothetical protein
MTVSELLSAARTAHETYRRSVPHMRPNTSGKLVQVSGDIAAAEAAVRDALRLRLEADALDPDHADPAWKAEISSNYRNSELCAWYTSIIAAGSLPEAERQVIAQAHGTN